MDKMFDKLTDSRWFMKLVALVLALLLFGSVYDGSNTNDINVPGDEETDTISDIPVKSYFDTENLVVTGVPSTVEVTLTGPTPNLQAAKAQKDFEVYVDLSKVKVGKQRIKLQIKDLSDKLKATMDPEYIEIDVQEKVTKEFSVDVEFDDTMVEDGYVAGSPVVKPNKVAITGGKEVMDQISYVRAIVELDDFVTDSVEKSAIITVLDANLNKLNVTVEQETVRVSVPIKRENKTVPIETVRKGSSPTGVTIDSITLNESEATITGSEDSLDKTENVRVEVDISAINESTELTLPVIISEGIIAVDPKEVKVTVKVNSASEDTGTTEENTTKTAEENTTKTAEENTTKTAEENSTKAFSNLPIRINGLTEEYSVAFLEPTSGETNVTVVGTNEALETLKESDFQLSVDVSQLTEGEHKLNINVDGPENANWTTDIETASIVLTEKEAS
jgi:YbbR domain-containing protein